MFKQANKHNSKKVLGAYSLVEVIVSMVIVAIILLMLHSVIINAVNASRKALARSTVREAIASITDQIVRDVRAADEVTDCGGPSSSCTIVGDETVIWAKCGESVCKYRNTTSNLIYRSPDNLEVESFTFESGFGGAGSPNNRNILVTIIGGHQLESVNVHNILRQVSVSTRNYIL